MSQGGSLITKDGVTVAKEIELSDPLANIGAQRVKEVASKTAGVAGHGTTTATVLAQAIYAEGAKRVSAGANPTDIKRGIDAAVAAVVADLARQSRPIQDRNEIAQVGTISANGDPAIGQLIAEAMERVGKQGLVSIEEAKSLATRLDVVEGMQFDRGYLSPYFVTDPERLEATLENAYVFIYEKRLSSMQELLPLLEQVSNANKPLLIIAEDIDGEALATLVVNKLRGVLQVCAVRAPGCGERRTAMLQDIAVLLGGQAVSEDLGIELENATFAALGRARTITVGKNSTTLIEGAGKKEDIQARVKQLRAQVDAASSDDDRENLQERLAMFAGGVAIIKVGAATETELKEKKARVEDALHATRAAVREGIVPGGGVALLRALPALDELELLGDELLGLNVIRRALEEPLPQMAQNGGVEGAVIEPTKAVRVALQSAASMASLMLTTEALIAERPERDSAPPGQGTQGDTGM